MTSTSDATTVDASALVEQLSRYRIFDPERLATLCAECPGPTASEFISQVLEKGALTPYQAGKILSWQIPDLVVGPYRITDCLKSSGFGALRWAVDASAKRSFRIRLFPIRSLWQARVAKRLVQAQSQLSAHPALIPLTDVDSAHGQHYLVWPRVEGDSLASIVREAGPWAVPDAVRLIRTLAEGLSQCHRRGFEHGFLHPESVLIGTDGQPRLLDLGAGPLLALNLSEAESMLDSLSEASYCADLIATAAPELLADPTSLSPAADQYGLGVIAHFTLTGLKPFEEEGLIRTLVVRQSPQASLHELDPGLPEKLTAIVDRMLSFDPSDRFLSMDEVIQALTEFLVDQGSEAPASEKISEPEVPASLEQISHRSGSGSSSGGAISWSNSGPDPGVRPVERDDSAESIQFDLPEDRPVVAIPAARVPSLPLEPLPILASAAPDEKIGFNLSMGLHDQSILETRFNDHDDEQDDDLTPPSDQSIPRPALTEQNGISRLLESIDEDFEIRMPDLSGNPLAKSPTELAGERPLLRPSTQRDAKDRDLTMPFVGQPAKSPPNPDAEHGSQSVLWKSVKRSVLFWHLPSDRLQVSLFGPSAFVPGTTVELEFFMHTPDAADSVRTMSRAFLRESELLGWGPVAQEVKRESTLAVHIALANAGLSQSLMGLLWRGQPHRMRLTVHVPWESPPGKSPGIISVGKDNVRIGRVDFQVNILPRTSS